MIDPRAPKGWLTDHRKAILFLCLLNIASNFAVYVVARVKTEARIESKLTLPTNEGFQPVKGEELVSGVLYDADIEDISVEFARGEDFSASPGKSFLYFKFSRKLTQKSIDDLRERIDKIGYITERKVYGYGLAVEKAATRGEENRDPKKILHPWQTIYSDILRMVQEEQFEQH